MVRLLLISGAALSIFACHPAQAQVTLDFSKITCDQWVHSKVTAPRTIAVWLSGYYSGKHNNTVIDLQQIRASADRVEWFCRDRKNFKVPVMQAVEQVLGPKQ
jgi:hypothetical protein